MTLQTTIGKIAVVTSGTGRSLESIIKYQEVFKYSIAKVIVPRADCEAVQVALDAKLEVFLLDFDAQENKEEFEEALRKELESLDLIVLTEFNKEFPILKGLEEKTINVHPSLLPRHGEKGMYGLKVHRSVLASKDKVSGVTIHLLKQAELGKRISQITVPVNKDDNPGSLALRVFDVERVLLPVTIKNILKGVWPAAGCVRIGKIKDHARFGE